MKNKILVVGGSGFLGHNLLKKISLIKNFEIFSLTKSKYQKKKKIKNVKYISCDIRKLKDLKKKINKNYEYVINLSGNIDHKKNNETFEVHYNGLNNLLKTINLKKLELFLQIGSCLEYGRKPSPQKENFFCKPISYYGKAKYMASNLLQKKTTNFIILRPYQVYGPYQKYDRLIPMVIKSCLKNKNFPCTQGNQERDFLYVDDFTDLIIKILKKKKFANRIFNVGYGKPVKVKKIINLILKITSKGNPLFGNIKMRKDEVKKLYPDLSLIKKELKWKPKISLKEGLKRTVAYYAKN